MRTHPLIETDLDETEQRFVEFVELHPGLRELPSETVRVQSASLVDDDSYRELHSIEIRGYDDRVWRIEHSLTRTESWQARSVQLVTQFELTGPGVPDHYGRRPDIEALVDAALDALKDAARRFASSAGWQDVSTMRRVLGYGIVR